MRPLYEALADEGFSGTRLLVDGDTIRASLSHARMSTIGRAVGRAARLIALHAPDGVARLELTFVSSRLPVATYRFNDLELLRGYFTGTVDPLDLQPTLAASYANADAYRELREEGTPWDAVIEAETDGPTIHASMISRVGAFTVSPGPDAPGAFRFQPLRLSWLFNDPSGAFKYDLFSTASYSHWFTDSLYAVGALRLTLAENVSDAEAFSNSVLPHVRSDIAEYRRAGGRVRMQALQLGHIANPTDRVYTWLSAGYLEEMYGGAGGEVLYLPETGNWAIDFAAYGVRKREFDGGFGFRDYQTITALGSFHYRIPQHGLTLTTRVGRFLARDNGVRFEVRRRFLSGFEVGAWYSHTDGKDITSPGSPENPYRDKGVFLRFAIGPFQSFDSGAAVNLRMAAWTRDPGQMVGAPGGLYSLLERRLMLNLREQGIWSDFGY
ncbi:MAG: YjbH domain-containing protein [Gammaproteobacteria bacterium]